MTYTQALDWLHSLPRFSKGGLTTIRALLKLLSNPEKSLKFVHIAGTNGKGSATVMLASVLTRAGYKTGANISPYVIDFRERFQINGEMISQEQLLQVISQVHQASQKLQTQYPLCEFEAVTAVALLWFAQQKCDIVCLEVGLGGRLDATNAIENTLVSCIMHIAKDHTELLGDTFAKIAAEKCAILKNNCNVIVYPQQEKEAMDVILLAAKDNDCEVTVPNFVDFYFYKAPPFENRINYGGYDLNIPFCGRHQAFNAAVVLEAALALCRQGFDISDEDIIGGIENAKIPARIEVISKNPYVIIDGAHNPDGAGALRDTLKSVGKMTGIIGILQDKDTQEMLKAFSACFNNVYTVAPNNPRAMSAVQLAQQAKPYFNSATPCDSLQQALQMATAQGDVCVCGSLYLAADARKYFNHN